MKLYEQDMTSWREVTPLLFKDFEQALQFLNYTCSAENKEVKIEENRKTIEFSFPLFSPYYITCLKCYIHTHTHSTLEGHSGTVWALQQKKELLISGAHDKTVHNHHVATM